MSLYYSLSKKIKNKISVVLFSFLCMLKGMIHKQLIHSTLTTHLIRQLTITDTKNYNSLTNHVYVINKL